MLRVYHLNCLTIVTPANDLVSGHCLLLENKGKLALVDTGIGLSDCLRPTERIGQPLIDMVGYRFDENQTALRQIQALGLDPASVTDCIISHFDNDHIGGLPDFPQATVHAGIEELGNFHSGNPRYLKLPLEHNPTVKAYSQSNVDWFGFEARSVNAGIDAEILLIPLFGHTLGHCGVAVKKIDGTWLLYAGDAYYLRAELTNPGHPVNELAKIRADDNDSRLASVDKIRKLVNAHPGTEFFGYHDIEEFRRFVN
jgi:glyoxylase-like metal-dependent hydrolase (beta-lactamase superfamily II)